MKKTVAICVLLVGLCLTSMCLASDSSDLASQQKITTKVLTALNAPSDLEYSNIGRDFTTYLKRDFAVEKFSAVKKELRKKYGIGRDNRLLAYQRFYDGDRLTYLVNYSKNSSLVFTFVFDKNDKLAGFSFTPSPDGKCTEPRKTDIE